ncbi:hypothetical protein HHU12_28700 [Flammeovirga aprica JL-4]|uniref:Uncharacterized protein n=2 Tax=Flammeovirga aprica TaxID=29528 RepID=A0A7X9S0H6_9BACT|nr:hypothetical protein [Flammeovirga aprica JL-4]
MKEPQFRYRNTSGLVIDIHYDKPAKKINRAFNSVIASTALISLITTAGQSLLLLSVKVLFWSFLKQLFIYFINKNTKMTIAVQDDTLSVFTTPFSSFFSNENIDIKDIENFSIIDHNINGNKIYDLMYTNKNHKSAVLLSSYDNINATGKNFSLKALQEIKKELDISTAIKNENPQIAAASKGKVKSKNILPNFSQLPLHMRDFNQDTLSQSIYQLQEGDSFDYNTISFKVSETVQYEEESGISYRSISGDANGHKTILFVANDELNELFMIKEIDKEAIDYRVLYKVNYLSKTLHLSRLRNVTKFEVISNEIHSEIMRLMFYFDEETNDVLILETKYGEVVKGYIGVVKKHKVIQNIISKKEKVIQPNRGIQV